MNRSTPSKPPFRLLAFGAILLTSLAISIVLPYANLQRVRQAHRLGDRAQAMANSSPDTAAAYWEAGLALSPKSYHLAVHLAQHYEKQRRYDAAAITWQHLPEEQGSDEAVKLLFKAGKPEQALDLLQKISLRVQDPQIAALKALTLAELGDLPQAADVVRQTGTGDDQTLTMLATVQSLSGINNDEIIGRMSAPEALERVHKLKLSKIALSAYFYDYGLLGAAERALESELGKNSQAHVIKAQILSARKNAIDSQKVLVDGLRIDPANIELRRLLEASYRQAGTTDLADRQLELVRRLEYGQP
jgi:Flp pilus assembly protein TadD